MSFSRNLTALEFGLLTARNLKPVNHTAPLKKDRHAVWECECSCQHTATEPPAAGGVYDDLGVRVVDVPSERLVRGQTLSCGCLAKEIHAAQKDNPTRAAELIEWAVKWRAHIKQRHAANRKV